ncbi:fibronectin type III [Arthrobacter methylotrophus]|uniref:Fibronectin type III n=1 Tax=Arthrobacter methylotrophus TaxID=121291 RepID=A0ABV5UXP2_9MICC
MKNLIARYKKRRRDAGVGLVDAIVGIGLASIIIGGPILYFTTVNQNAAGNAATQSQNTAISTALDRTVANIQASDTILYAGPNELVTSSTEVDPGKADNPVITRWVVNGTTLYQQAWSGKAGVTSYDRSTLPTAAGESANLVTRVSVDNLQLTGQLFTYSDKAQADLPVTATTPLTTDPRTTPNDGKRTYDIALVNIAIKAGTIENGTGKTGMVESKTSAAPRGVSGKSDGSNSTPQCPAVLITTSPAGLPVITWNTMPGFLQYQVSRNSGPLAVVTAVPTDTQKSYTDATITPGPVDVVQYRVQAMNPDGSVASIACTPKTWSPQIGAPVFKNSTVLPSATQAHEWTDGTDSALGLKKPRIVLSWTAVAGADSYDLKYRQLDPVTGNPLTTGFTSAAAGLPAATTTFTWDEGGWANSYEWYIIANARTGQSGESAHITTLTHPPAPQNVTITPQYGTGSARLTSGNNVITWNAVPTAVAYDVWRYNSGSTGAVTLLGELNASTLSYTDAVPYGTTYTYYVSAINDGPRGNGSGKASSANPEAGVAPATGVMPTASFKVPSGATPTMSTALYAVTKAPGFERAASTTPVTPAPTPVTQLQYPPVPAENQSRDYDGYNELVWNPSLSATGYQVARFDQPGGAKVCLTAKCGSVDGTDSTSGGTTATKLDDRGPQGTGLANGTKYYYAVQAYNPTGVSVDLSTVKAMTQRPAAPALTLVRAPSQTDPSADFSITQNADAGNSATNKFCTTTTCEYDLLKGTTVVAANSHTQSGAAVNWNGADSPDGSTTTFTARSKNEAVTNGGYSNTTSTTVNTYPGGFWVAGRTGDLGMGQGMRIKVNATNISDAPVDSNGATTIKWSGSAGAATMDVVRRSLGGDTVSPGGDSWGLSRSAVRENIYPGAADGGWDDLAAPGAVFQYSLTATAPNGLKRTVQSQPVLTPAATSKAGLLQVTCSGTDQRAFTQAQIGYTSDGSYYTGAMSWPYPQQIIGAKLISDAGHPEGLDGSPVYGIAAQTDYLGIVSNGTNYYSPDNFSYTGWNYSATGRWNGGVASGTGKGYYQGLKNGFDVVTRGVTFQLPNPATGQLQSYTEPDSAYITATIQVTGTFQFKNTCAPAGSTGNALIEPPAPCYSFTGAYCAVPAYENRPKWLSW